MRIHRPQTVPGDKFTFRTATAVIIANMVGTGVFASLGFQLLEFESGFLLAALWLAGGLAAFCGAMSYAELGAALPRSGGEYNFLSEIYHPAAGFVSGWISATIGFAAPTALAAITFGAYAAPVFGAGAPEWSVKALACALVTVLAVIHASNRRNSGGAQIFFTVAKIAVIIGFCAAAFIVGGPGEPVRFLPAAEDGAMIASGAFAVALIYVSYAYTGWNAATYLSGEIENPQRELPRILMTGTLVVMALYVALNIVFLRAAPAEALRGQIEIGFIAAQHLFGEGAARATGGVLALLLISTVSAMTMAGPRVLHAIGEDFPALSFLARTNVADVPSIAIYVQSGLALVFILTSSFQFILIFAGFAVALNSFVAVLGLFVLRWRRPELARPYRVVGFPITPLIYLTLTGWTLTYVLINRPAEGGFALAVIAAGFVFYGLARERGAIDPGA